MSLLLVSSYCVFVVSFIGLSLTNVSKSSIFFVKLHKHFHSFHKNVITRTCICSDVSVSSGFFVEVFKPFFIIYVKSASTDVFARLICGFVEVMEVVILRVLSLPCFFCPVTTLPSTECSCRSLSLTSLVSGEDFAM